MNRRPHNNIEQNDLEYLSDLAFTEFHVSEREIRSVNARIRKRIHHYALLSVVILLMISFMAIVWLTSFPSITSQKNKINPTPAKKTTTEIRSVIYSGLGEEKKQELSIQKTISIPSLQLPQPNIQPEYARLETKFCNHLHRIEGNEDLIRSQNSSVLFVHDLKLFDDPNYRMELTTLPLNNHVPAAFENKITLEPIDADQTDRGTHFKKLKQALLLIHSNNSYGAGLILDELRIIAPADINVIFYSALCCYRNKAYDKAKILFEQAILYPVDVFREEATYYHALCLLKENKMESATHELKNIAANNGFYSNKAIELLNKQMTE